MRAETDESALALSACFVVTSVDRRFVEFAGVMLHTLALNGDVDEVNVTVFCDGLTPKDKSHLRRCGGRLRLTLFELSEKTLRQFEGLKTNSNWSRSIYTRLVLPDLLGCKEGRLVYLDADTIVVDSLRPLLNLDMSGMPVAAVSGVSNQDNARLKLPDGTRTMNSGVLLIDIVEWLKGDLSSRCLEIVRSQAARLKFFDQDALNIALAGQFASLDRRWNVILHSHADEPAIFHFTHDKPNSVRCQHPAQPLYLQYRQATPWAKKRLKSRWHKRISRLTHSVRRLFER
ncbi:glycosyltransferase family 8 protein [Ensifer sp. ENS09]|uniref:glycosyltransferase family 8 protein n=1 Tax=Ensifer sp. ENS09 TaxID=2769263 RepID=UPI00178139C2|nr:glycosyltransferase family 8 protein [Ensifer sp. ENS09]MBD9648459.1 glycosyltransferase family 8 protein [Ensifer sp. ENS09]